MKSNLLEVSYIQSVFTLNMYLPWTEMYFSIQDIYDLNVAE